MREVNLAEHHSHVYDNHVATHTLLTIITPIIISFPQIPSSTTTKKGGNDTNDNCETRENKKRIKSDKRKS